MSNIRPRRNLKRWLCPTTMGNERSHAFTATRLKFVRHRVQSFALSPREKQILLLLIRGFSNKEIAGRCTLSVETVKEYVKHIYR